jgi:hypothetical protein
MRDLQISRPVLIALVGAVLVGGFLFFKANSSSDVAPPAPAVAAATGATGGSTGTTGGTGGTGGTGASGPTMTKAEIAKQKADEKRKALVAAAEAAGMPLKVYTPLQDGKTVLIFFGEPKGQDDQHVNQAVNEVKQKRGSSIVVIKETVSNKSKYDGIAKAADITQSPGIIILYKDKADTWQGYIDGTALNARVTRLTGTSS